MNSKRPADILGKTLKLPCGAVIKNRFCKSATSETLGDRQTAPTRELIRLYGRWAQGGAGLCVTGNVMIDAGALGEPGNVAVEDERHSEMLKSWARYGTRDETHLWMQLNHPGKQSPKFLSAEPVAPSAIGFRSELKPFFNPPRGLTETEIHNLIERFARTAGIARSCGFTGVQIHGAHGYLVSQFLSPLHNQREDQWGGSLENRMRFVTEIYRAIRQTVGHDFPVGIKLNSSDFMKGGFSEEESVRVATVLADLGIDLVEISGGTYERPAMAGIAEMQAQNNSEPYFLSYANRIRARIDTPIVITGGFRTAGAMAEALLENNIQMVGLARPMILDPDLPEKILSGQEYISPVHPIKSGIGFLDRAALLEVTWYEQQLRYLGQGKSPRPNQGIWYSLAKTLVENGRQVFQKRRA